MISFPAETLLRATWEWLRTDISCSFYICLLCSVLRLTRNYLCERDTRNVRH